MTKKDIPYEVRWAKKEEWFDTMEMVWKTFLKFEGNDYTEEGINNFFEFISDGKIYDMFLRGEYQLMIALDGNRVVGAGSIRNRTFLSLLFVDEDYHRQNIGRTIINALCDYIKNEEGERYMSLKASPYAVNFYRKLGFKIVAPEESYSGIRVTAMEKIL